jgi:hypothetical protein
MSTPYVERGLTVMAWRISGAQGLNTIDVFWWDGSIGVGTVTITCFDRAWSAYFGAMGKTIRQFFAEADTDYLTTKLGLTTLLKCRKRDLAYLAKIIDAIKAELNREGAA